MNATATSDTEITAELTNIVKVNTTIANYFRDTTEEALRDLRAALRLIPAGNAERDEVLQKIDELLKVPKDDPSWLDRIKKFTGDGAKIVGNLAKVAAPVATAWNIVAPFFGAPQIPMK